MFNALITAIEHMIKMMEEENHMVSQGDWHNARIFAAEKEIAIKTFQSALQQIMQSDAMDMLKEEQKYILHTKLAQYQDVEKINFDILQQSLKAHTVFFSTLLSQVDAHSQDHSTYQNHGGVARTKPRSVILSVNNQY